jgi:hypothetical protein
MLGGGGQSQAQEYLPLDEALSTGPLPNYDTDRDGAAGLLVQRGAGLGDPDTTRRQRWFDEAGGLLIVNKAVTLDIWATVENFDQPSTGHLVAGLYNCAANKTGCVLVASGSATFSQSSFGADFGPVTVPMGTIDLTLLPGRALMVEVAVPASSGGDLWLAYATTTYPASLRFS